MEKQPVENFKAFGDTHATGPEYEAARHFLSTMGLDDAEFVRPASRTEDAIELAMMVPKKRASFDVQWVANLSLDPATLVVISYRGPTLTEVTEGQQIPELDPEYLAYAANLSGGALGVSKGRRFAMVQVQLSDEASTARYLAPALGWISEGHKRVTALDGIEYPVVEFKGYTSFETAATEGHPGPPTDLTSATLATPALLEESGQSQLGAKVLHFLRFHARSPLLYDFFTGLHLRYRVLVAHHLTRAEDTEALALAERLCQVEEIRSRLPADPNLRDKGEQARSLTEAIDLRDDLRRRISTQELVPQPPEDTQAFIGQLDSIDVRRSVSDSPVDLARDPRVAQLVDAGEAAILPLINAIGTDRRFTRSVTSGRGNFSVLAFHRVREAELIALKKIWPSCPAVKLDDPALAAEQLRTSWAEVCGLSEPMRMLVLLRNSDPAGWPRAAAYLGKGPVEDQFRSEYGTEVSELIVQRALEMASSDTKSTNDLYKISDALEMGHRLAQWQGPASLPQLQLLCSKSLSSANGTWKDYNIYITQTVSGPYGTLIQDRLDLNDPTAPDDLIKMLSHIDVGSHFQSSFWNPIAEAPSDSAVGLVRRAYFDAVGLDKAKVADVETFIRRAIQTRLLLLPEVRRLIVRLLNCSEPAGVEYIDEKGDLTLRNGVANSYIQKGPLKPPGLAPGVELPITRGDRVTYQMSRSHLESPPFEIWSPPEVRDPMKHRVCEYLLDDSRDWKGLLKKSRFADPRDID